MRKSGRHPRGGRAKAAGAPSPRPDDAAPRADVLATRDLGDSRALLERILDTPHLARVIPQLQPEVLHRVIQTCGLEDCGELMALATPDQLARVFDLDLWRAGRAGAGEQFDADRFGVWLEVLVESSPALAAKKLAEIDLHLIVAAFAQHVLVFDKAASSAPMERGDGAVVAGYQIVATRTGSWDAILAVLIALEEEHPRYFHRLMSECRSLSNSGYEIDGLDDLLGVREQAMLNVALDRERRREHQGYVTPPQAAAFLQMARGVPLGPGTTPPGNPLSRAYFRDLEETTADERDSGSSDLRAASAGSDAPPVPEDAPLAAAIVDVLVEAGVLPRPPRALLEAPQGQAPPRLTRMQAHMQFALESSGSAHSARSQELAYLVNVLAAGCSVQARPLTLQEASDAAVAVCNLGLENWPPHWLAPEDQRKYSADQSGTTLPDDFLVGHDLVNVFQAGWAVLYRDVCMYAAEQLIAVLTRMRCADRAVQTELDALRVQMTRQWQAGAPWRAHDALDVIALLDTPAWAALVALIDKCPVMHAGIGASQDSRARTVSASAFEFISENSQIAAVREFMQSLPDILSR